MTATHGPRMNRERTREVIDKLKIRVLESDGHGILIRRLMTGDGSRPSYHEETWRVYTGGGIAGNSDQVWLRPTHVSHGPARGPFWNKGQLEKALRAWRRGV